MHKSRIDNLKPFTSEQNREKARENGRVGGIASGEARRRRRDIREFLQSYLDMGAPPDIQEKMAKYGVSEEHRSNAMALFIRIFAKAMKNGDVEAASAVLEWAGCLPLQEERETAELAKYRAFGDIEETDGKSVVEQSDVVIYTPATGTSI